MEVVENRAGSFQKSCESGFVGHVLGQVGQKNCEIETDFLGRLVETVHEDVVVDFAVVIHLTAGQQKFYFFTVNEVIKVIKICNIDYTVQFLGAFYFGICELNLGPLYPPTELGLDIQTLIDRFIQNFCK